MAGGAARGGPGQAGRGSPGGEPWGAVPPRWRGAGGAPRSPPRRLSGTASPLSRCTSLWTVSLSPSTLPRSY